MTNAGNRLLHYIERIERLQAERKALDDDIKDVKADLKSAGFDLRVVNRIMADRRMAPAERAEFDHLHQVYRAAIGMLDGTPLGDAARKRFDPPREPSDPPTLFDPSPSEPTAGTGITHRQSPPPVPAEPTPADLDAARAEGRMAQGAGVRIGANPYGASDPRRAAWDEGWCGAAGSDGMHIPPAWRRTPKPGKAAKPNEAEPGEAEPSDTTNQDGAPPP